MDIYAVALVRLDDNQVTDPDPSSSYWNLMVDNRMVLEEPVEMHHQATVREAMGVCMYGAMQRGVAEVFRASGQAAS